MATPHLDPIGALDLAVSLGFDGVDMISQTGYRCGLDPAASAAEVKTMAAAAAARNIPIRALTPYFKELNAMDRAVRSATIDGFKRAIEHASILGASSVRVLAGTEVAEADWNGSLAILVESLRVLGDFAARHGVGLNIENHDGTLADDATRTSAVWRAVDHPAVGIIYDPANLIRDGKEDFPESLALQADGVRVVHVKDYIFDAAYPNGRRAMAIGAGVIPWPAMLSGLRVIGYDGDLSIEYETRWVPEQLPEPAIGLKQSRDYLRQCLGALRAA